MGPERVLPNSEDELGEEERPADGNLLPVWSGSEGGGEDEEGGEMELDGEEEEGEEEVNSGGYYYQPLNQEPDGMNNGEQPGGEEQPEEDDASHGEQLQQMQNRIQVSSHLNNGYCYIIIRSAHEVQEIINHCLYISVSIRSV